MEHPLEAEHARLRVRLPVRELRPLKAIIASLVVVADQGQKHDLRGGVGLDLLPSQATVVDQVALRAGIGGCDKSHQHRPGGLPVVAARGKAELAGNAAELRHEPIEKVLPVAGRPGRFTHFAQRLELQVEQLPFDRQRTADINQRARQGCERPVEIRSLAMLNQVEGVVPGDARTGNRNQVRDQEFVLGDMADHRVLLAEDRHRIRDPILGDSQLAAEVLRAGDLAHRLQFRQQVPEWVVCAAQIPVQIELAPPGRFLQQRRLERRQLEVALQFSLGQFAWRHREPKTGRDVAPRLLLLLRPNAGLLVHPAEPIAGGVLLKKPHGLEIVDCRISLDQVEIVRHELMSERRARFVRRIERHLHRLDGDAGLVVLLPEPASFLDRLIAARRHKQKGGRQQRRANAPQTNATIANLPSHRRSPFLRQVRRQIARGVLQEGSGRFVQKLFQQPLAGDLRLRIGIRRDPSGHLGPPRLTLRLMPAPRAPPGLGGPP